MHDQSDLNQVLQQLRSHLPELAQRYHVSSLAVFGSYVRDEQRGDSDIDLLVTFDEVPGLLQFIRLEQDLTDILGVQVDLVMRDALKPVLGTRILDEVVQV